jgi:hypothetical protein
MCDRDGRWSLGAVRERSRDEQGSADTLGESHNIGDLILGGNVQRRAAAGQTVRDSHRPGEHEGGT